MSARPTAEERFHRLVEKTDGCWLWRGHLTRGYGSFKFDGRTVRAHRFSYELHVGPIPEGLTLDHLCRVRNCVRPEHLEPVTLTENIRRGDGVGMRNARKVRCSKGHPFTAANTRVEPDGRRTCLKCEAYRQHAQFWIGVPGGGR